MQSSEISDDRYRLRLMQLQQSRPTAGIILLNVQKKYSWCDNVIEASLHCKKVVALSTDKASIQLTYMAPLNLLQINFCCCKQFKIVNSNNFLLLDMEM